MKKLLLGMIPTFIIILIIVVIISLNKKNDIILTNYSINDKSNTVTLYVTTTTDVGGAREISVRDDGKDKYITFYSTYPLMSKSTKKSFVIELNSDCENIYFNRGNANISSVTKKYKGELFGLVLKKDKTLNSWELVK